MTEISAAASPAPGSRWRLIARQLPLASAFLIVTSGCQTTSVEQACRSRAAAGGVQLDEPAIVQPVPGTEQVIYGWEPVHNGRPGMQCTTQRGHVQDIVIFGWNSRS